MTEVMHNRLLVIAISVLLWACPFRALAQCPAPWWSSLSDIPGVHGYVNACIEWDPDGPGPLPSLLVVGGQFDAAGHVAADGIAAWDGSEWRAMGNNDPAAVATCFLIHDGELYAGGSRRGPGRAVARWTGAAVAGRRPDRRHLHFHGQLLLSGIAAAGQFFGVNRANFWNGQAWQSMGDAFEPESNELFLVATPGPLYIRGNFWTLNGQPAENLAVWSNTHWEAVHPPVPASGVALDHDQLLMWGGNNLYRYGDQGWTVLATTPALDEPFRLTTALGGIYFTEVGSPDSILRPPHPGIVRLDNGAWTPLGFDSARSVRAPASSGGSSSPTAKC